MSATAEKGKHPGAPGGLTKLVAGEILRVDAEANPLTIFFNEMCWELEESISQSSLFTTQDQKHTRVMYPIPPLLFFPFSLYILSNTGKKTNK